MYHTKSDDQIYVWEYILSDTEPVGDEQNIQVKQIFNGTKKGLTLNQILDNFSSFTESQKKKTPVYDFKSEKEYPINETLLPLFKRKLIGYIYQSKKFKNLPSIEA